MRLPATTMVAADRRNITVDDVIGLRHVDTLSVSPDGGKFAIFVRQADPATNDFLTAWYVGDVRTGKLSFAGDGGVIRPRVLPSGQDEGEVKGSESKWSPDGRWFAYTLQRSGEVQLWVSAADGSRQQQVTHNAADVEMFTWSRDSETLYFATGRTREEISALRQLKFRQGYEFDEDLSSFTDLFQSQIYPQLRGPIITWAVSLRDRLERRQVRIPTQETGAVRRDGTLALLANIPGVRPYTRLAIQRPGESRSVLCPAEECAGSIHALWWSDDEKRVFFWRTEGINDSDRAFYAWSPDDGRVSVLFRARDFLLLCTPIERDSVLCARETPERPQHLATVDLRSGHLAVLTDLSPQIANVRLGRVESIEWQTPSFPWNEPGGELAGLYGRRTWGYLLYPPDFDPAKKYPVFIDPYSIGGFENNIGPEHPLHVYAASGFIVLSLAFPMPASTVLERLGGAANSQLYSRKLGFPHLSMLAASTLRGLDTVAARGFIDEKRVGIGGVSHGTFVPLYIVQQQDRFAAVSISSPHWGPIQYYLPTRRWRRAAAAESAGDYVDWVVKPVGEGADFWSQIDLADHVEQIEAPILMNLADRETIALLRLIRHMDDAGKPYQAYVFPREGHVKWQPAHLETILSRNLDWFRFWLQGHEDSSPAKVGQYAHWRRLRGMQYASRHPE